MLETVFADEEAGTGEMKQGKNLYIQ